jgi:hypothetical protein
LDWVYSNSSSPSTYAKTCINHYLMSRVSNVPLFQYGTQCIKKMRVRTVIHQEERHDLTNVQLQVIA